MLKWFKERSDCRFSGFEQFGLEPIPAIKQIGGLWPLFNIYSNLFINPGTLITSGMMAVAGLSFFSVV